MRILILSQWFEPEPALKGLSFARTLVRRGHQVEVLTGFPNYPGGQVYPGYHVRPWQHEIQEGIPVHRVALYPSHDRSGVRRMLNYASFGLTAATIGPFMIGKPDVIYIYNLVSLGLAACVLRALKGAPFVYDVLDLWPDAVASSGMMNNRFFLRVLSTWCNWVYHQAAQLVTYSPGVCAELVRRGAPEGRVTLIYNWCNENAVYPQPRIPAVAERWGLGGAFNVMFAGNMGVVQALDAVLHAAALLQRSHPHIRFVLVGDGIDRDHLQRAARERGLSNVLFLPRQPKETIGSILAFADVLLVHLKDDPAFYTTIPSKTQAYLAAGIPVLMAVRGDAADLVLRSGGGLVCEPENPASIVEGVLRFYAMSADERQAMGQAGHAFYERELSLGAGVSRFEEVFSRVIASRS
jgi:colanic acid biosynthesis glycosyl transferase WcaI